MAGGSLTKLLTASAEAIGARCPLRHSVMGGGAGFYSVSAFAFGICRRWSNCSDISLWQVGLKISFHRSPQRSPILHAKFPDPWIHQNWQIIDCGFHQEDSLLLLASGESLYLILFRRFTLWSSLSDVTCPPLCTISCCGNCEAGVCWRGTGAHHTLQIHLSSMQSLHCKCEHFELQPCSSPVAFLQHISCPVARFQFRAEAALALFNSAPINIKS